MSTSLKPGLVAALVKSCTAERSGHVTGMNARDVGMAVVTLGGGRSHADDAIDPSVGLTDMIGGGGTDGQYDMGR